MPYDPRAPTEDDRSYMYKVMWAGLPLAMLLLASLQFPALSLMSTLAGGFVSGLFIGQAWSWYYDEFMQKEVAFASGWALSLAGVVLFLSVIPNAFRVNFETATVIALMAVVLHIAIYWRRIRDGAFA